MKASKVLLRWYKSFNLNYTQYADFGVKTIERPWNRLLFESTPESDLPFIEISLERDITTIVGANESGKSHLLSAISKVVNGTGLPDSRGTAREYSRTDLCHYSSIRSKNADAWPNIGLEFSDLTATDAIAVSKVFTDRSWSPNAGERFTLILAPDGQGTEAFLFPNNENNSIKLDSSRLNSLRGCLPEIQFIRSNAELSDDIHIADILSHFGLRTNADDDQACYPFATLVALAKVVKAVAIGANNQISTDDATQLASMQSLLRKAPEKSIKGSLEAELFRVLGISPEAIKFLADLKDHDRSYAESLVDTWNDEIDRVLNLSHYWQQDDQFQIRMNYKRGNLYFEITDKTNAVYTFRERSSGLRYFLSYYIQAKSIQMTTKNDNCIILMDEPDSFLSITGQRNLLAVFESLVSADSSLENSQLVYTTHSPFLINRNFPRRVRLVRKGDAEEGTQAVSAPHVRRYEPIRSALGIDCAQTLFMGATNVIVEGTTDQFLINELVRYFAEPDNLGQLIDLNAVVLTSANGAGGPEHLLASSQWGDEPRPATLVMFDNDEQGKLGRDRITIAEGERKQLIGAEFAFFISDALKPEINDQKIVSIEDVVPSALYAKAVSQYFSEWYNPVESASANDQLKKQGFGKNGVVNDTKEIFANVLGEEHRKYDKMGVLREVIFLVERGNANDSIDELRSRFFSLCHFLREKTDACEHAHQVRTGKQAIKRIVSEFFVIHRESSTLFDVKVLIKRLERETELLGDDGENLLRVLNRWTDAIAKMRAADQQRLVGQEWLDWKRRFELIKRDPINIAEDIVVIVQPASRSENNSAGSEASRLSPKKPSITANVTTNALVKNP